MSRHGLINFKKTGIHIFVALMVLLAVFSINSCAPSDGEFVDLSDDLTSDIYEVCLWNQSQFELSHLFIYDSEQTYSEQNSYIESNMLIDGKWKKDFTKDSYHVTVTRKKNQDSQLFAFTTATPIELNKATLIEYFDESYRTSKLSDECSDISADTSQK